MVTTAIIESLTTRQPSDIIVRQEDGKIILELWKKPITLFGRVILRKAKLLKTVAVCESCNDSYVEEYSKFVVDCFNENPTGNRILDLLNLALALNTEAQYGKKIPLDVKCTSLTKLIRRVFKFDKDLLDDGIVYNMPPEGNHVFISINFVNWVDCEMEDKTDVVTDKAKQWIIENMGDVLAEYPNVGLAVLGTGRESDAFVAVDPFSPEELSE